MCAGAVRMRETNPNKFLGTKPRETRHIFGSALKAEGDKFYTKGGEGNPKFLGNQAKSKLNTGQILFRSTRPRETRIIFS